MSNPHEVLERLFGAQGEQSDPGEKSTPMARANAEGQARRLRNKMFDSHLNNFSFKPRDLITWKEGHRYSRFPLLGQPAVVLEVLDPPIPDPTEDAGNPRFMQRLDLKIGIIDPRDEDYLILYVDSRYFQPFAMED